MTTLVNVTQTLEQLAYLGFSVGRGTAVTQQRVHIHHFCIVYKVVNHFR